MRNIVNIFYRLLLVVVLIFTSKLQLGFQHTIYQLTTQNQLSYSQEDSDKKVTDLLIEVLEETDIEFEAELDNSNTFFETSNSFQYFYFQQKEKQRLRDRKVTLNKNQTNLYDIYCSWKLHLA